jgi:hypothetical protein
VAAQKVDEMKNMDIEVREISFNDLSARINKSWVNTEPKVCADCQNDMDIKERFFVLSRCPENEAEEERLDKLMNIKHGVSLFCVEMDVPGWQGIDFLCCMRKMRLTKCCSRLR